MQIQTSILRDCYIAIPCLTQDFYTIGTLYFDQNFYIMSGKILEFFRLDLPYIQPVHGTWYLENKVQVIYEITQLINTVYFSKYLHQESLYE